MGLNFKMGQRAKPFPKLRIMHYELRIASSRQILIYRERHSMTHRELMTRAIELAKQAASEGEVPVGAVIACNGEIIAEGRNMRENGKNALYHAEIIAIDNACKALDCWRLDDCTLYVTLEPCPMCTGAIINSRIKKVVYGAYDLKAGSVDSVINLFNLPYNHRPEIQEGFMENECRQILTDFFASLRNESKYD